MRRLGFQIVQPRRIRSQRRTGVEQIVAEKIRQSRALEPIHGAIEKVTPAYHTFSLIHIQEFRRIQKRMAQRGHSEPVRARLHRFFRILHVQLLNPLALDCR